MANRKIDPETVEEVRYLVEDTHTRLTDISKRFGVSRNTLTNWIKKKGWNVAHRNKKIAPNKGRKRQLAPEEEQKKLHARREWEVGQLTKEEISSLTGVPFRKLQRWIFEEGWTRKLKKDYQAEVREMEQQPFEVPIPAGKKKETPPPEPVGEGPNTPDLPQEHKEQAVATAKSRAEEIVGRHKTTLAKASNLALDILDKMEGVLHRGEVDNVIVVRTKSGGEYVRLPFLGDRESIADAYSKIAQGLYRLIPLERQAWGIQDKDESRPLAVIQIGSMGVKFDSQGRQAAIYRADKGEKPPEDGAEDEAVEGEYKEVDSKES